VADLVQRADDSPRTNVFVGEPALVETVNSHRRTRQADPIDELTPREPEILALMAESRSNQGICRALWLSPKTVETHIRGAFAKPGISAAPDDNRRVLAVLAYLRR
jgi:DNA-binding CsgD family transcriptional regulator